MSIVSMRPVRSLIARVHGGGSRPQRPQAQPVVDEPPLADGEGEAAVSVPESGTVPVTGGDMHGGDAPLV